MGIQGCLFVSVSAVPRIGICALLTLLVGLVTASWFAFLAALIVVTLLAVLSCEKETRESMYRSGLCFCHTSVSLDDGIYKGGYAQIINNKD
jgi:hypothetical protein